MTLVLLPVRPGPVPVLTGSGASASALADDVRLAAVRAQEASDGADAGALGASWSGPASVRATHAMTLLARDVDDLVAALWRSVTALDAYAAELAGLELERERLVELRSRLDLELDELERTVPLMGPDQVVGAQVRANLLGVRIVVHEGDVTRWWERVTAAEDRVMAELAAVDTVAEAREHAASRSEAVGEARADLVASGVLPAVTVGMSADELVEWLVAHPEVAGALARARPVSGEGPVGELAALAGLVGASSSPGLTWDATAADGVAAMVRERARALFESLSTEDARLLAMLYPGVVGSLGGVPFDYRADANRVLVVDALTQERAWQEELLERRATTGTLVSEIDKSENRMALYESILTEDRTIVFFDPSGDGAMIELHGRIDEQTRHIGVDVPGTGAELAKFQGLADRSQGFYRRGDAADAGSIAMISWLGGDYPDEVLVDAFLPQYSEALGPMLVAFSEELNQEITYASDPDGVPTVTVEGHSYGGAVLGVAERLGLVADRTIYVEAAGMGQGVFDLDDLPASQANVDRYVMTAPGDPILVAQLTGQHGGDPDRFPGVTVLHTGYYKGGDEIVRGGDAHSGVYKSGSDAWGQLYEVITGGTVETYRTPQYPVPTLGLGVLDPVILPATGFADDGGQVDVP